MPFTSSEMKSYLAEANRDYTGRKTWESMYGAIDYSGQKALSQAESSYGEAVGQAYESSLKNAQDIMSSNIGTGYKSEALMANQDALAQAYASYQQNYLSNAQAIQQNINTATQQVDAALTTQAKNMISLYDTGYQYLQNLYDRFTENYDDKTNPFYTDDMFKRYLTDNGELKSRQEYEAEWFNEEGELTLQGQDFFDQMLNYYATSADPELRQYSYGAWLQEQDPDLFEWARSYNPYDYETGAKNINMFQKAFTNQTDEQWSRGERDWSINKDTYLANFDNSASKIDLDKLGHSKEVVDRQMLTDVPDDLDKLYKQVLDSANAMNIDTAELKNIYDKYLPSLRKAKGTILVTYTGEIATIKQRNKQYEKEIANYKQSVQDYIDDLRKYVNDNQIAVK